MSTVLQIISVDHVDSSPSLLLITENNRYLFDAGEGTQRLAVEHRIRLGKLQSIFITRLHPNHIGGIPGMCLTAADAGSHGVTIFGPNKLKQFWDSTQYFMKRANFHALIQEVNDLRQPDYTASDIDIHPVLIHNTSSDQRLCYLIRTPSLPGKFDIDKAAALKIPKGPLFAKLKSGEAITLLDGTTVTPSQVLDASEKSQYVAVIASLDGMDNLHSLTDNIEFARYLEHRLSFSTR